MQTKFNETRFTATSVEEAQGMYLAKNLYKRWQEDVLDQSTGEVVTINRSDLLMKRGEQISGSNEATLNFLLQAGEVTEFEVTDQYRPGIYERGYSAVPWTVTANVKDKNRKFILYARGAEQALEIAKDYIELKFPGSFELVGVKGFGNCIAISDNFNRGGAENDTSLPADDGKEESDYNAVAGKFYLLELHVTTERDVEYDQNFLVFTTDAEKAKELANAWIASRRAEEVEAGRLDSDEDELFNTTIITATTVNCYCVIPPDFTKAYLEQEKEQENN